MSGMSGRFPIDIGQYVGPVRGAIIENFFDTVTRFNETPLECAAEV